MSLGVLQRKRSCAVRVRGRAKNSGREGEMEGGKYGGRDTLWVVIEELPWQWNAGVNLKYQNKIFRKCCNTLYYLIFHAISTRKSPERTALFFKAIKVRCVYNSLRQSTRKCRLIRLIKITNNSCIFNLCECLILFIGLWCLPYLYLREEEIYIADL